MSDHFGNIIISGEPEQKPKRKPKSVRPKKPAQPAKKKKLPVRPRPPKKIKERKEINWNRVVLIGGPIILGLLVLYTCLGFFLVPRLLRTALTKKLQETTGLEYTANRTSFNPFTFRTTFRDISIREPKTDKATLPIVQINLLDMNLNLTSLLRSRLVCTSLDIKRFRLVIVRDKHKQYNFSRLSSEADHVNRSEIIEFSKLPFLFSFNDIVATQGEIIFKDDFNNKQHRVEKINLSLPTLANFTHPLIGSVQPRFSAIINGSPLSLRGEKIAPIGSDTGDSQTKLSCDIKSLDLPFYFGYLPSSIPLSLTQGTANGTLQLAFTPGDKNGKQLAIDFDFNTTGIELHSKDNTLDLKTPTATLKGTLQPLSGDLHIRDLTVQEPVITVRKRFSQHSLVHLLPFLKKTDPDDVSQKLRKLIIDNLLVENGTTHLQNKAERDTWNDLFFNLRHYNNQVQEGSPPESEGTFSLNAEKSTGKTAFSWKGTIDAHGRMAGEIAINDFPAASFFSFLDLKATQVKSGTASLKGHLALTEDLKESRPLNISFENTTITLTNLRLSQDNQEWLHAPKLEIAAFSTEKDSYDLGNLFIRNGSLSLTTGSLPELFTVFSTRKQFTLHGIDYSGDLKLTDTSNTHKPFSLTNIQLQANHLDQLKNSEENVGLLAKIGKKGDVKLKGNLSLHPIKGSFEVSFTRLPLARIAHYYTTAPRILSGQGSLYGQGQVNLPGWNYKGSLEIRGATFTWPDKKNHLSWTKGTCRDFLIQRSPFELNLADLTINNLKIGQDEAPWIKAKTVKTDQFVPKKDLLNLGNLVIKGGSINLTETKFPPLLATWLNRKTTAILPASINYSGSLNLNSIDPRVEPLHLSRIRLQVEDLDTNGKKPSKNLTLTTRVNENGNFTAKGSLSLTPVKTTLATKFSAIPSQAVFPWITQNTLLRSSQAVFSGKGSLHYPARQFSGSLKVTDARIRKDPDTLLLGWRSAQLSKLTVDFNPLALKAATVTVDQPGFGWPRTESSKTIYQQARSFLDTCLAGSSGATQQSATLSIGKITLKNGSIQYIDKRLQPSWLADITALNGTFKTINTSVPDTETTFNLTGSLAGSPFTIDGATRLFAPKTSGHSLMKLTTFPLTLFDKQLSSVLELDTDVGTADLVLNSKWTKGNRTGSGYLTFASLTAASSQADTAVPIALMSDLKNSSELHVSLNGDESQPSNSLFTEVVNTFQTKLIKAQYSPVLLAGPGFSDLVNRNGVDCIAGKKVIADTGRNLMGRFSDLVKGHPKLMLKLIGMADTVHDRAILKKELEAREAIRVREENIRRQALRKQQEALKKQHQQASQKKKGFSESDLPLNKPEDLQPIHASSVTVPDSDLRELARDRAREVYDQLMTVNGLTPEQLLLSQEVRLGKEGQKVEIELAARP